MAKPRIFISMHYLELGGAEMSLIGLLNTLDPGRVDVDLFIHAHRGELMRFIPEWVNLLPELKSYSMIENRLIDALKSGCFGVVSGRLIAALLCRWRRKRVKVEPGMSNAAIFGYVGNWVTPFLPDVGHGEYDLAISFLTPHNIVARKVKARRKAAWIHTDYSRVAVDTDLEYPVWNSFDNIVSISDDACKAFSSVFSGLTHKLTVIENIISPLFVRSRADDSVTDLFNSKSVNLLSVGRFCKAKNFDNVPDILRRVLASPGMPDVKWYIIGFGGDENLIRSKIATAGMENNVIVLGKRDNPYPYMKACDIYVQPSRYEGKSVTVREAQILCKPVAVAAYPTATSQITDGVDGVILPQDNEAFARDLAGFILDTSRWKALSNYLASHDYGNEAEVEKIYRLLQS